MSLIKVPLILSAALGFHIAVTTPNVPSTDERVPPSGIPETFLFNVIVWGHPVLKGVYWAGTIAEVTSMIGRHVVHSLPQSVLSTPDRILTPSANITPAFIVGSMLIVSAGLLRWFCYRELGRLFTFALSVRKGHKLVTTGPYSVVRHPSYTGAIICMIGVCIMHGSRGSWLRESGILDVIGVKELVMTWLVIRILAVVSLVKRIPKEDEMMKENFQDEWLDWSSRVKYRLIPGIY
ncbi:hypothetical protein BV22DRAFT_1192835 [Leucogyrophana mollusca]|uniref:Uncharacterized protein n=1 Tax=Leucogyrophana mollusca TaxID=85980 RepID=A0ACB8BUY7_9AGAM|nr:hypothetical protein BV22DRAFT_1192835 [Leucogyrophana mollusca]